MFKSMRTVVLVVLASLLTVLAVNAQTETATEQPEDAEATQFVAQAWTQFTALDSYHFSYDSTNSTTLTPKDGSVVNTTTVFHAEGNKINADNQTAISASPSNSNGTVTQEFEQPLEMERIVKDGTVYVNLQLKDTPYADIFNVEDGWWRYADLQQQIGNTATGAALENFVMLPLPSSLPFGDDVITSVKEQDGETIDGKAMRVFDIELNALQLFLLRQNPTTGGERIIGLLKEADMLAVSQLSATARLWIGADDGQVYQLEGQSESLLPYLSSGHEAEVPYDIHTTSSVSFTVSVPETPIEITVPKNIHAS